MSLLMCMMGPKAVLRLCKYTAGGIPGPEALLHRYCSSRGLALPSPTDWAFYLALSIFRLLSILAGRWTAGA